MNFIDIEFSADIFWPKSHLNSFYRDPQPNEMILVRDDTEKSQSNDVVKELVSGSFASVEIEFSAEVFWPESHLNSFYGDPQYNEIIWEPKGCVGY